ncbi:hypothetical protein N9N67_04360 [Bacteriovoracaceae bacterium]|nr:hypothetical protein [Bacteriovoracaceae bacterium]
MARRRKRDEIIYKYNCSITEEEFKIKVKASNPEELISVNGYYELSPEKDDRPAHIKKRLGIGVETEQEETKEEEQTE